MRLTAPILWPLALALLLAPFVFVAVPGLGDYLNHLARMHILLGIGESPALQRYYEVHWSPIPYLAMDAVVPLLGAVLPLYLAGKIFVLSCVALPVAATAFLHRVVHGRISLVPVVAALFGANTLLAFGFLNYLFSIGCALLLFAFWVASAGWPRWRRPAVFAVPVLVLYFGHAYACAGYCLAVCGFELGRAARVRPFVPALAAADCVAALVQAAPALVFAATLNVQSGYVGSLRTHYGALNDKLAAIASPVLFLHDGAGFVVVAGALVLFLALLPRVRLHPALWPAMVPVALAAAAMPHVVASTWGMDLRFPLLLALLFAASGSVRLEGWARVALVFAFFVVLTVKSADAWLGMRIADDAIAETRGILAGLPEGARLLVVNPSGRGNGQERIALNTVWHMPMTAAIDHDAFLPTLFSGLTTVRIRPAYRLSSTPNGLPVTPAQLRAGAAPADSKGADAANQSDGEGARLYWQDWPQHFDYVLVQRYGADVGEMPDNLQPIAHTVNLDLYRVR